MKRKKSIWEEVETVSAIFANSSTIKAILVELELPLTSANYRAVHRFADAHNLSVPAASNATKTQAMRQYKETFRPLDEEIFVEKSPFSRAVVKKRLLDSGFLEYKCYGEVCQNNQIALNTWFGISLQLEHKNGVGDDNRIENLEFLCPNCHSMTSTFGARNIARYEGRAQGTCKKCNRASKREVCLKCLPPKKRLSSVSIETLLDDIASKGIAEVAAHYGMAVGVFNNDIRRRQEKINRIIPKSDSKYHKEVEYGNADELAILVQNSSMLAVAKTLGVSDSGLRKHLKKVLGADHPLFNKKS